MKKILSLLLTAIMILSLLTACQSETVESGPVEVDGTTYVDSASATIYVKIVFESFGTVLVQLSPEDAPITVANFQKLVGQGFYNGLTIHRVEPGFVIQGGDPKGNGTGGSGEKIKGEFASNGVVNNLSHKRGVLSMARTNDLNSATSQFFVCLDTVNCTRSLDGKYAAFGWVISGIDVIDRIAGVETFNAGGFNMPTKEIVIKSMTFVAPLETETTAAQTQGATDTVASTDTAAA